MQIAKLCFGLSTVAGPGRAGPVFFCSVTGRAEPFSGRAGLDIFGLCRALTTTTAATATSTT